MALPSKTPRIAPKDYELATIQRHVADTTDALITQVNKLPTNGGPATFTAVTATTITASAAITGASYTGGPVTGTTGIFSTVTAGTVTGSASVVSGAGFKQYVGPFYYSTASASGSPSLCSLTGTSNTGTVGSVYFPFVAPYAGSILAVSGCLVFGTGIATAAANVIVYPVINEVTQFASPPTINAGLSSAYGSVAKGNTPFNAGDRLTVFVKSSAGTAFTIVSYLVIEMSA